MNLRSLLTPLFFMCCLGTTAIVWLPIMRDRMLWSRHEQTLERKKNVTDKVVVGAPLLTPNPSATTDKKSWVIVSQNCSSCAADGILHYLKILEAEKEKVLLVCPSQSESEFKRLGKEWGVSVCTDDKITGLACSIFCPRVLLIEEKGGSVLWAQTQPDYESVKV